MRRAAREIGASELRDAQLVSWSCRVSDPLPRNYAPWPPAAGVSAAHLRDLRLSLSREFAATVASRPCSPPVPVPVPLLRLCPGPCEPASVDIFEGANCCAARSWLVVAPPPWLPAPRATPPQRPGRRRRGRGRRRGGERRHGSAGCWTTGTAQDPYAAHRQTTDAAPRAARRGSGWRRSIASAPAAAQLAISAGWPMTPRPGPLRIPLTFQALPPAAPGDAALRPILFCNTVPSFCPATL